MKTSKRGTIVLYAYVFAIGLAIVATAHAEQTSQIVVPPLKEYRIVRSVSEDAQRCIDCHAVESKGIVADWAASRHGHANISCLDCHAAGPADPDVSKNHLALDKIPISAIVSPKDCSRCHPAEAAQYARSKHANTLELYPRTDMEDRSMAE